MICLAAEVTSKFAREVACLGGSVPKLVCAAVQAPTRWHLTHSDYHWYWYTPIFIVNLFFYCMENIRIFSISQSSPICDKVVSCESYYFRDWHMPEKKHWLQLTFNCSTIVDITNFMCYMIFIWCLQDIYIIYIAFKWYLNVIYYLHIQN